MTDQKIANRAYETLSADPYAVRRFALATGRPSRWVTSPERLAQRAAAMAKLLRWCLSLPGAQLGVDPQGIGLMIRSIYFSLGGIPDSVASCLEKVGAANAPLIPWPADPAVFGGHIERMTHIIRDVPRDEYVWLDKDDAEWWINGTAALLQEYAHFAQSLGDHDESLFRLFTRHRCTVFGSITPSDLYEHLIAFEMQENNIDRDPAAVFLEEHRIPARILDNRGPFCFSWRLIDFSRSGALFYHPLLVLWSSWPSHREWAPAPPASWVEPDPYPRAVAANLLEQDYWTDVETMFAQARMTCGIGLTDPEVANMTVLPPIFYFLEPVQQIIRREDYLESFSSFLYPVISVCLGGNDPTSPEFGWGVIEGNIVALRRELVSSRISRSYYLMLPLRQLWTTDQDIEETLCTYAHSLTFLEHTMGGEAQQVLDRTYRLENRISLWGGGLSGMNLMLSQATSISGSLAEADSRAVIDELHRANSLVRRMQIFVSKLSSDVDQVELLFEGYYDANDDFIRRRVTAGEIPYPGIAKLPTALLDCYPYHYIKQPFIS